MIPPTVNGLPIIGARIWTPWRGVWIADVEYDPGPTGIALPAGPTPSVILCGSDTAPSTLTGVVDADYSGTFAGVYRARIVGGRGGWSKTTPPQQFNTGGGPVLSSVVIAATASLVGEIAVDPTPISFAGNWLRTAGPASRVFGDRDWHVDYTTGVATTAPWVPGVLDPSATIIDYDAVAGVVKLKSDALVTPGTVLVDTRFGATSLTVRDVEQVFDRKGSEVTAWVNANATSRVSETLAGIIREFARTAYLRTYRYALVSGGPSKLTLKALDAGAPDLNPIDQWSGMTGVQAKLTPGTVIVVGFTNADPSAPYVISYSPLSVPLELDLAGGANFLVPAPWAAGVASALSTLGSGLAGLSGPLAPLAAIGTALQASIAALPPGATLLTKAT